MLKYNNNVDLRKYIDKLLIDQGVSKVQLAGKMECKPQQLNNILNKKNLSFGDIKRICEAMGCDLYIDIRGKE